MDIIIGKVRDKAVSGIKGLLKKWYAESKPSKDRSNVNRFRYDAGNVRLFGRDEELALLWDFCHADSHFSWYAISGEGGSGKTRLAHTLGTLIEKRGHDKRWRGPWVYYKVDYAHEEGLAKAKADIQNDPRNTLLVLDYVKWHTDSIGEWLYGLWREWHDRDLSIRVLLVERDSIVHDLRRWQHNVIDAQYQPAWPASFLNEYKLMQMQPLRDEDIMRVVEDFAASTEQQDLIDAKLILKILKEKVDPTFRRPLYALFLADAQIMGENLLRWERKDALHYVYLKEIERINILASGIPKNIVNIVCSILLIATLSGGMSWDKFADLLPKECARLRKYADDTYTDETELLASCLGLTYSEQEPLFIPPLEPDLLGEFYSIQELFFAEDTQRKKTVGLAMLNDLRRSAVIFDRIAHDYGDLLAEKRMEKLFTEISLPESIMAIGVKGLPIPSIDGWAFSDCASLKNIDIPNTVTSISDSAFFGCEGLTSINIPDSVTAINFDAFFGCINLASIVLSDFMSYIGDDAFGDCPSLKTVYVRGKVTDVIREAFEGMNVEFIEIPKDKIDLP